MSTKTQCCVALGRPRRRCAFAYQQMGALDSFAPDNLQVARVLLARQIDLAHAWDSIPVVAAAIRNPGAQDLAAEQVLHDKSSYGAVTLGWAFGVVT